jgi:alanine racemase
MKNTSIPEQTATFNVPVSTHAEVHLGRLNDNIDAVQHKLGSVELIGVVKANAYGHGSIAVSRALISKGVTKLAVATVAEAIELRNGGIGDDIIVLAPPMEDRLSLYADFNLQAVVESEHTVQLLKQAHHGIQCHVKIDTGMGRLGQSPEESIDLIRSIERASNTELASIWTHFARADESDLSFTRNQFDRFLGLIKALGGAPAPLHTAASASAYAFPPSIEYPLMSMARIGIALYGLLALPGQRPPAGLNPIMEFFTKVSSVKTVPPGTTVSYGSKWVSPSVRRIATISAGYADGVPRLLNQGGVVRIGQALYPIIGTICMDMFMVDLGNPEISPSDVAVGDKAVIFGKNTPTCFEVADLCSSISYVQVCSISSRVPRFYSS